MRKIILLFLFGTFFCSVLSASDGYFIGDGARGKRILIHSSTIENGSDTDLWIPEKIRRDITNDLVNWSNMEVIDSYEKKTIRQIQKDSSSELYSNDDPIELGKTIQAKSYIRLVTTCRKEHYSLTATIVNIETGRTEGSFTSAFYSEADYITKVHGEASASLLEQLGIHLTSVGRRLLQYGTFAQTESESEENIAVYQAELARLEEDQISLRQKRNTEIDIEAINARIEVQKATLIQQQKNEEERLARIRKDEKRRLEEEQVNKERNEETKKKIIQLSNDIEKKAIKIRKQKSDNLESLQRIELIEGEKQILASNELSIAQAISTFNAQQDSICQNEINERINNKPRAADLNPDGSLSDVGRKNLESDLEEIRLKHDRIKKENINDLDKTAGSSQEKLRKKIISDMSSLKRQKFSADSIADNNLHLRIGNYNGDYKGWEYILTFIFDGEAHTASSGWLTYKEITGLDIPNYPEAGAPGRDKKIKTYQEYQDNVETYDSFFRMNVPYIQAVLTYSIIPCDYENPSQYDCIFEKIEFTNVQENKKIKEISPNEHFIYQYEPLTIINWNLKGTRKIQEKTKEHKIAAKKAINAAPWADQNRGSGSLNGIGLEFGSKYLNLFGDIPIKPWFFADFIFSIPYKWTTYKDRSGEKQRCAEEDNPILLGAGLGVNKRFHFSSFHPSIYYIFDFGYFFWNTIEEKINYGGGGYSYKTETAEESLGFINTFGLSCPVFVSNNHFVFAVDLKYSIYHVSETGLNISQFTVGGRCSWYFP